MKPHWVVAAAYLVVLAACAEPRSIPRLLSTPTATLAPTATPAPAGTTTPLPEMSPETAAYLEAALDIMEENSINRLQLDWEALRAKAVRMAGGAQEPAYTYPAVRYVLRAAGGVHSFFLSPREAAKAEQFVMTDSPPPRARLLLGRLSYVAIAGFGSSDPDEGIKYATMVQQHIRELDAQSPCGWIVDLRQNTGGNMWPMLAGLGPLLGEGVAGKFIDPEGLTTEWSYRDGQSFIGDEGVTQVPGAYQLQAENPPVAVLIGANTASSGEAMVISFLGRPNTRSFGHSTTGLTTANAGYPLSDGAVIYLTTAVMADRTGQAYGAYINPDEVIDGERQSTIIQNETIPQPAIDWLLAQPACLN